MVDMLTTQVIALSWFRCLMEEGYDFKNKITGHIETNEVTLFKSFQKNTEEFDLPAAKCSPKGLEKNLYEVIGNLIIHNTNPAVTEAINSSEFKAAIQRHLNLIRNREFSGKVPA